MKLSVEKEKPSVLKVAKFHHILLLGLSIKLGGAVAAWHNGLLIGIWGYFIATLVIATGYFCLYFSIAELSSIISFPGGHYGYVRTSVGPFWGYVCGMMSLMESIFFLAVSMLKFGQATTIVLGTDRAYEYLWWVIGYGGMICFHIRGGITFWHFMSICTIVNVTIIAIYLLGSINEMDFNEYAYRNSPTGFKGGALEFFLALRLPGWFFVGTDLITCTCEEVKDARQLIPKAIISVMSIMFVISLWLQLTVAGQSPGLSERFYELDNVFPLGFGFGNVLKISSRAGVAFSILPQFASCTGFTYAAGRQLNAMARSNLLPEFLKMTYGENKTPIAGMLVASLVGLIGLVFAWFYDPYTMLFRMAMQGGCISYILVLVAYIKFRTNYGAMNREFTSPLKIPGAILGILIFLVVEVALLFVLPLLANWGATIAFLNYSLCITVYYYLVVEQRQCFSEEEREKFFKTYIVNANMNKRRQLKSNYRISAHSSTSGNSLSQSSIVPASSVSRLSQFSRIGDEVEFDNPAAAQLNGNDDDDEENCESKFKIMN